MVYSMQILRGVAAVLMVLHHFNQMLPWPEAGLVLFGYYGDMGVDIFFLISGFVMVKSTENPQHSGALAFGIRRFFRVVPLAQLCTLLYFGLLLGKPALGVLLRSLAFIPLAPVDPPKFGWSLVPQVWTLTYELVFYGLFGIALLISHPRRLVLATGLILASIFCFQLILGGPFSWRPEGIHLPAAPGGVLPVEISGVLGNPLLLEFVAGMGLAWAYEKMIAVPLTAAWRISLRGVAVALLVAFVAIYFSTYQAGHGLLNKHGYGAVFLVASALLLEATAPRRADSTPSGRVLAALMWLGAISYPLYLVHLGIVGALVNLLPNPMLPFLTQGLSGFLVYSAVSVALAALLHAFVEMPCMRLGKRLARA